MRHVFILLAFLAVDWILLDARMTRELDRLQASGAPSVDTAYLAHQLRRAVREPIRRIEWQ